MARITVTVCDECGKQEGVRHFEIREGTRKAVRDLCDTHSGVLDQLLGEPVKASQKPTKRAARPRKVTTIEEIEAMKRQKQAQ